MVVNGIKLNRIIFQCVCELYSINTSHSQETAEANSLDSGKKEFDW
jgi:hypothetical protein